MQKLDKFKITCPQCQTETILKASSEAFQGKLAQGSTKTKIVTLDGKCLLCNTSLRAQILDVANTIKRHNKCIDKLNSFSDVEIIL